MPAVFGGASAFAAKPQSLAFSMRCAARRRKILQLQVLYGAVCKAKNTCATYSLFQLFCSKTRIFFPSHHRISYTSLLILGDWQTRWL